MRAARRRRSLLRRLYWPHDDDAKTADVLGTMDGLGEFAGLAVLIDSLSADGVNYLDNAQVEEALEDLITALLNPFSASGINNSRISKRERPTAPS